MADGGAPTGWDVVSETGVGQTPPATTPAQPGGWNVVSQLAPPAPQPESPGRDLLGLAEIGGTADLNFLKSIPNAAYQGYERIFHGDANKPSLIPYSQPGAAGQEYEQRAGADPFIQNLVGPPISAVVNAVQSHLSPQGTVVGDVERLAPGPVMTGLGLAGLPAGLRALAATPSDISNAASGIRALLGGTAMDVGGEPTAADIGLHPPNNPPLTPLQRSANVVAANEAGIQSPDVPLSQQTLKAANAAPDSVYNRLENAIPGGQISGPGADMVRSAGMPEGGRVSSGSPNVQNQMDMLRQQLLAPTNGQGQPWTGTNWINEMRALRQEGYNLIGSDDVDNQALGQGKLAAARGVERFILDSIPPNSDVSADQFLAARLQRAKNATVQAALRGNNVDLGVLARIQRSDPELLTGGLKTLADFAFENQEATRLSNRFQPSITGALRNFTFTRPASWVQPATAAASRLVNNARSAAAADAANRLFPPVPAERFGPLPTTPEVPGASSTGPTGGAPPSAPGGLDTEFPSYEGETLELLPDATGPGTNGSWEGNAANAASAEGINRPKLNLVETNGDNSNPVLADVTQVDRNPRKGHIFVDADTGKIVNSGGIKPSLAQGILARYLAQRALGIQF